MAVIKQLCMCSFVVILHKHFIVDYTLITNLMH